MSNPSSSLRSVRQNLREVLAEVSGRPLGEQFDPHSLARQIEETLYQAGWRFTEVSVPSKVRGDIVIQGIKGDQFIDVTVSYREESADVEVSVGRTSYVEGVGDPDEIVQTISSLSNGSRPAGPALRDRAAPSEPEAEPEMPAEPVEPAEPEAPQEQERVPGWMRMRNRPRSVGSSARY
jgi:hypothetical protein